LTQNAGGIDPLKNNGYHGKRNAMEVGRMLRSGTIFMIREKAQGGKSAYAIGKELGIEHRPQIRRAQGRFAAGNRSLLQAGRVQTAAPRAHEPWHLQLRGFAGTAAGRRLRRRDFNPQGISASVPPGESTARRAAL